MANGYKVILAHGRAAQFDIPAEQSQQWTWALQFSLQRVQSRFASAVTVDYAYFGDIWRPDVRNEAPVFRTTNRTEVSLKDGTHDIKETAPQPVPAGVGLGTRLADALLPDFALGLALRPVLPDVFQYLENPEYQQATNARLVDACKDKVPTILVGFSMGSIVGYEVLREAGQDFPVRSFITVGSPIGLGPVNRPLRKLANADKTPFPPYIRLWLNIWNDDDLATGIHGDELARMFPDTREDEEQRPRTIQSARNFGLGPALLNPAAAHNAMDYLSSLAMGVALHTAMLDIDKAGG
jgi:hypothetical protein